MNEDREIGGLFIMAHKKRIALLISLSISLSTEKWGHLIT